jgi:hypothetical protein
LKLKGKVSYVRKQNQAFGKGKHDDGAVTGVGLSKSAINLIKSNCPGKILF